jgi:hypothetical protein
VLCGFPFRLPVLTLFGSTRGNGATRESKSRPAGSVKTLCAGTLCVGTTCTRTLCAGQGNDAFVVFLTDDLFVVVVGGWKGKEIDRFLVGLLGADAENDDTGGIEAIIGPDVGIKNEMVRSSAKLLTTFFRSFRSEIDLRSEGRREFLAISFCIPGSAIPSVGWSIGTDASDASNAIALPLTIKLLVVVVVVVIVVVVVVVKSFPA